MNLCLVKTHKLQEVGTFRSMYNLYSIIHDTRLQYRIFYDIYIYEYFMNIEYFMPKKFSIFYSESIQTCLFISACQI